MNYQFKASENKVFLWKYFAIHLKEIIEIGINQNPYNP